jgi:hypothetical protein
MIRTALFGPMQGVRNREVPLYCPGVCTKPGAYSASSTVLCIIISPLKHIMRAFDYVHYRFRELH